MAFNPKLYTETGGEPQRAWSAERIKPFELWDYESLMILCDVPEWAIDAELWYPHLEES